MEPLTLITGALAAGAMAASKDVATQAVKDTYAAFKHALVARFGEKKELHNAVEQVEKKPESEARQLVLSEELKEANAHKDGGLVREAQALLDLLRAQGAVSAERYQAYLSGSGATAQGSGAVATGAGGIAAGRFVRRWTEG